MNKKFILVFIKQNWFKIGILVAVLVLALSIYGRDKPHNTQASPLNSEKTLAMAMQCRKDGELKLQEDKDAATNERYSAGVSNCYYLEPSYIFNKDLNTCLYSGGYTCDLTKKNTEGIFKGDNAKRWLRHIIDIYTNKTLAEVYVPDSSTVADWLSKQIDEFWNKSKELGF
jgi:hypothetical protein